MIHELGHFIVAKKSGVYVEEFGWGLPPRLVGKKIGETVYSINWLPFGGFVKVRGEDIEEKVDLKDKRNFANKSVWVRSAILLAGIAMNILLGSFLFFIVLASKNFISMPILLFDEDYKFPFGAQNNIKTIVTYIKPNSPADKVGIGFGEIVSRLEIKNSKVEINTVEDIQNALVGTEGNNVKITLLDAQTNNIREVSVTPEYDNELGQTMIGVGMGSVARLSYAGNNIFYRISSGFLHGINVTAYSIKTMGDLISISIEKKDIEPVAVGFSGPVGIFSLVRDVISLGGKSAVLALIDFTALLSFSLALLNIIPFPALDGGRFMFVAYEAVTKRRPNPKIEATIHKFGMVLLLSLMLLVTLKDIINL